MRGLGAGPFGNGRASAPLDAQHIHRFPNPTLKGAGRGGRIARKSLRLRYNRAMTLKEKILFHQVHPTKLATDIIAAIVSLCFFWQHDLLVGLVTHFIPPPIASAAVIHFANLEP